jgi:hypothetical protein
MPSVFFRMQLPNADHVIIDEAKIRDYLLAPEHSVGRFKAAFFAALGYQRPDWSRLASDLRSPRPETFCPALRVPLARNSGCGVFDRDRLDAAL